MKEGAINFAPSIFYSHKQKTTNVGLYAGHYLSEKYSVDIIYQYNRECTCLGLLK